MKKQLHGVTPPAVRFFRLRRRARQPSCRGRPARGARAQLSEGVRRTACQVFKSVFRVSAPVSSGGRSAVRRLTVAGRRPLPRQVPILRICSVHGFCWSPRERRAFARRPLDGIALNAIPAAAHMLRGDSNLTFNSPSHEHRVQASGGVNGRSGKPPSSGSWPAPNSRLKPTRPRSLAGSRLTSRASRRPHSLPPRLAFVAAAGAPL